MFLENQTILFSSDYDRGFYYNCGSPDIADASLLSKWINNNSVEETKPADVVSWYTKSVVPKLAVDSTLELCQFKFSLDYINIFGMTLWSYFNTNNTDFISKVILKKDKLEAKLTNFANIIIAFFKLILQFSYLYYKINLYTKIEIKN